MNGSHAPELTDLLKEITEDIAKYVIKEGQPIILIDEYSWYREVLSLMAKQVNLCDSCILLLENGMEQDMGRYQSMKMFSYGAFFAKKENNQ